MCCSKICRSVVEKNSSIYTRNRLQQCSMLGLNVYNNFQWKTNRNKNRNFLKFPPTLSVCLGSAWAPPSLPSSLSCGTGEDDLSEPWISWKSVASDVSRDDVAPIVASDKDSTVSVELTEDTSSEDSDGDVRFARRSSNAGDDVTPTWAVANCDDVSSPSGSLIRFSCRGRLCIGSLRTRMRSGWWRRRWGSDCRRSRWRRKNFPAWKKQGYKLNLSCCMLSWLSHTGVRNSVSSYESLAQTFTH